MHGARHIPAWLCPALALIAGCYLDHGHGADAGAPADAETCAREAVPVELECPPPVVRAGDEVALDITHGVVRCCSARAPDVEVAHASPFDHAISASWEVCSCCDACDCIGPQQRETVSLGVLAPGTHTIRAGERTCTVTVASDPPPPMCRAIEATEVRGATVLYPDQPVAATIRSVGAFAGCGCRPLVRDVLDAVELQVCDCCDACGCIDHGYEAGWINGPHPVGEHTFFLAGTPLHVRVVPPDSCSPRAPTELAIVGPDESLTQGGERFYWAVLRGSESLCCAEPLPAVRHGVAADGALELSLASCAIDPCDCVGTPRPYEAWHLLGELVPGDHVVRIAGLEQRFTVP